MISSAAEVSDKNSSWRGFQAMLLVGCTAQHLQICGRCTRRAQDTHAAEA